MLRALALAVLAAAHATLPAQDVTRTGKVYAVVVHPGKLPPAITERFADEAMAAVDAARTVIEKLYQRPTRTQTIHVWADHDGYSQVAKTPGVPFEMPAVARTERAEAHVKVQPLLTASESELLGLPVSVRHTIVEQAAALAALDRSEAARRDPWCANVFAAGVLAAVAFATTADGVDPNRDCRFWFLIEDAKAGRLEPVKQLVLRVGKPEDRSQFDWVHGAEAAVAGLLATTGNAWARKLLAAKPKAAGRIRSQRADALEAVLGTDWERSDERMRKLLAGASPKWAAVEPLALVRDGALLLAGGDSWAVAMAYEAPPAGPYSLQGSIEIVRSQVDSALDQTRESAVKVQFAAGKVTACVAGTDGTEHHRHEYKAPIVVGKPFTFRIDVTEQIVVSIDGETVAKLEASGRTMHDRWALMRHGGLAWFRDVRCEPVNKPR
jgi:hypothetical protein